MSSGASVTLDMSKDDVQLVARGQPRPGAFCQVTTSPLHRGLAADIVRS